MIKPIDQIAANTIRLLSADAVQKAKSGHPGLPMGSAAMAYALWRYEMKHNPSNPNWTDRDRFVLSAGHGSMLVYSLLHLFGYGLTTEDLKQFRQFGSNTPGHPEYGHTAGVETTTGPLGQGIANAVGFAIAETMLAARFNREGYKIIDHYTYALMGDGCMMEGLSGEACSLAGTLKLNKLIAFYDSNRITIEGSTDLAFTENVGLRYQAYGWQVLEVGDGNDIPAILSAIRRAKAEKDKPSLIIVHTQIGYGCPGKQGSAAAHGEPLGDEHVRAAKKYLGFPPEESFYVPGEVRIEMDAFGLKMAQEEKKWNDLLAGYQKDYPELYAQFAEALDKGVAVDLRSDGEFWSFDKKDATRNASGICLNRLASRIPNLVGGSADLAPSNKTALKGLGDYSAENRLGRNMRFGVREFAMAAIANGMALHGGLRVYVATFFVFSDYMKHAMRLSALMKLPVIYVLTHDSIGVGEDGPTHQPIEQLAALRAIPGLNVFRPADGKETAAGYYAALKSQAPTALVLTRQNLPIYPETGVQAARGGYILKDSAKKNPDLILIASGSEVEIAIQAYETLKGEGVDARVVSMPCMELFEENDDEYKQSVLPPNVRARVAVEAACSFGWHKYVGLDGEVVAIDHFGASAPYAKLYEAFGMTADAVAAAARRVLERG